MKRFFLFWITILFPVLILPPSISAYHYGDTIRSSPVSLELLAEVQERDVVDVDKGSQLMGLKFKGDAVSTRLLARLGLRPVPPLEVYGLVGGADLTIDDFDQFDAKMELAIGGGVHLVLFSSPSPGASHLFLDYSYLQFIAEDRVEIDLNGVLTPVNEEILWEEHVVKIGGDARHDIFRPYGGLRVSFVRGEDRLREVNPPPLSTPFSADLDLDEDDNVGVFGGVDIYLDPTDALALNLEVSLFDVNSIRAGLRFRF